MIDKRLQGGRLYLKKGEVVDVHPGAIADVSMDEGGQVLQVRSRGSPGRWPACLKYLLALL